MRWFSDYSGGILVDHRDIGEIAVRSWNEEFVPVLQESYMFEKPLSFNIALSYDYDEERLRKAIRLAGLSGLVDSLEDGLDTVISERASNISGGERKRIAIARALYRDGNVLLLDESFSSLDQKTQREIEELILKLEDKTILNISHNYDEDLLRKYDYVIYFKNGSVNLSKASEFDIKEIKEG